MPMMVSIGETVPDATECCCAIVGLPDRCGGCTDDCGICAVVCGRPADQVVLWVDPFDPGGGVDRSPFCREHVFNFNPGFDAWALLRKIIDGEL